VQINTDDRTHLTETLIRDAGHRSAMEPGLSPASTSGRIALCGV
jgi:hypothetical protein